MAPPLALGTDDSQVATTSAETMEEDIPSWLPAGYVHHLRFSSLLGSQLCATSCRLRSFYTKIGYFTRNYVVVSHRIDVKSSCSETKITGRYDWVLC
jgi:hypothetical protein